MESDFIQARRLTGALALKKVECVGSRVADPKLRKGKYEGRGRHAQGCSPPRVTQLNLAEGKSLKELQAFGKSERPPWHPIYGCMAQEVARKFLAIAFLMARRLPKHECLHSQLITPVATLWSLLRSQKKSSRALGAMKNPQRQFKITYLEHIPKAKALSHRAGIAPSSPCAWPLRAGCLEAMTPRPWDPTLRFPKCTPDPQKGS